ncbi:hypothetical protein K1T71_001677 [Dendrolimus kikuchii]|uniref:Uncharacterized protein n=1 Tax=Dendrolimus kikuchii TaxID=765133 RepID=A0ACC1DF96_9NEOP|nr:hypothetical protein K1T71_001677 [Dendrolimus kikuchii]
MVVGYLEKQSPNSRTRTGTGSFPNSVVFPGGVSEPADNADSWTKHFASFGYNQCDFESFHHPNSVVTPIFQNNPVQRYDFITDADTKYWREKLVKNPEELLNLCKEYSCYPDIWSLHFWSNWLTPSHLPKRFNTAFFVAALETKPNIRTNSEVAKFEWSSPLDILSKTDIVLYPPQAYEFYRLSHIPELDKLIAFAKEKSWYGGGFITSFTVKAKDGRIHPMPGDDLYTSYLDNKDNNIINIDKTILELRESSKILHRLELAETGQHLVIKNYKPEHHINMGDKIFPVQVAL